MKKMFTKTGVMVFFPVLIFTSCLKTEDGTEVETITKGEKWGIRIGSTPEDVFSRLQSLGREKGFYDVAIVYRQPYADPTGIQHHLDFYDGVTLRNNRSGRLERAVIRFSDDVVDAINVGGALPTETDRWPTDVPEEVAITKGDPVGKLYEKLLAIYQQPDYSDYGIVLPDKTLRKPFDPDMENYNEWAFTFFEDTDNVNKKARSSVRLYFDRGRLDKIHRE